MTQDLYLSTKITIKIPNDPIFSGTYTFSRNQSTNKWELMTGASLPLYGPGWPDPNVNTLLFDTSLPKYSHAGNPLNNTYLIKLNSVFDAGASPYYPGYLETLAKYNDLSPEAGFTYTSGFAWPAHFIMTAIKPPCSSCSDYQSGYGDGANRPSGSGHRLVVGFSLPLRYREITQNWIVVDYPAQTEPNRYHALSGINNSNVNTFNYITGVPPIISNSNGDFCQIKDFKTTNNPLFDPNPNSLFDLSVSAPTSDLQLVCTGIKDIGFAFRSSGSGLGYASPSNIETNIIDGWGDFRNNFYVASDSYATDTYDGNGRYFNGAFYDKVSVDASVKFYSSCRVGVACEAIIPDAPHSVTGVLCVTSSQIFANSECNGSEIDNSYINNYNSNTNLNTVDVFFIGPSGFCPCIKRPSSSPQDYIIYESVNQETLKVKIPYAGSLQYNSLLSWIKDDFAIIKPYAGIGLLKNLSNINNLCYNQYPVIDVSWNFQSNATSGSIIIKPTDIRIKYPRISVTGANISVLNGDYSWADNHQSFIKYVYDAGGSQIINSLIIKKVNESYLSNTYNYVLGSGSFANCNDKIPYSFKSLYFLPNLSPGVSPLLNTQQYHLWSNNPPTTYGLSPVPSSIAKL
jgi:hypothetical protein